MYPPPTGMPPQVRPQAFNPLYMYNNIMILYNYYNKFCLRWICMQILTILAGEVPNRKLWLPARLSVWDSRKAYCTAATHEFSVPRSIQSAVGQPEHIDVDNIIMTLTKVIPSTWWTHCKYSGLVIIQVVCCWNWLSTT